MKQETHAHGQRLPAIHNPVINTGGALLVFSTFSQPTGMLVERVGIRWNIEPRTTDTQERVTEEGGMEGGRERGMTMKGSQYNMSRFH